MKVHPTSHRILVQFHFPSEEEGEIVLPKHNISPSVEEKRTRVECLDVADDTTVCKIGDFLLLHADTLNHSVPITKEPATALIHDSMVLAIILDDAQYVR